MVTLPSKKQLIWKLFRGLVDFCVTVRTKQYEVVELSALDFGEAGVSAGAVIARGEDVRHLSYVDASGTCLGEKRVVARGVLAIASRCGK